MSDDEGLFDGFDVEDDDGDVRMAAEARDNPMKRVKIIIVSFFYFLGKALGNNIPYESDF